jgi:competence protein ComEC
MTIILICALFSASLLFNKYQRNLVFGFTITISLFLSGLVLYTNEKNSLTILKSEPTVFACTLSDFPAEKENSYMLTVKLNRKISANITESVNGSMLLYNKKDSSVNTMIPGDLLIIKCTPLEIVNRGNPCEFDYRFYMENQGIRYYAFTGKPNIIKHAVPDHRKLTYTALILREKLIEIYKENGITGERLALVAAMTLGQRNMLDPEQKQNFIRAGVMHIMAVSGLHSVILSAFVFSLLFFMKGRWNVLRIIITILILWAFAFVTGLTPSVLRATLMFSFFQAGKLMKRDVNGVNSVLASAFVLILIRPSVIFDAGFLLSYSAVIYIICFYQDFYLKLHFKNWLSDKIWQSAVVTIVAQLGTLPLTIMLFNRFPTYFILTNIIIVPLSSLLIIVGCIVPMVSPIHFLSRFIALILNYLTGLTELLTAKASSLPWSNLENIGMTTIECMLLTGTIFLFTLFIFKKHTYSIIYPLVLLMLFSAACTLNDITTRTTNEIIVYNTSGSSSIGLKTGKILNLYSDTIIPPTEVLRHCAASGLKLKVNILTKNTEYIKAGDRKIMLTNVLYNKDLKIFKPDIVILTGLHPGIENNISPTQLNRQIIVTSKAASGFHLPRQDGRSGLDTIHLVRKSGAFIELVK